MKTVLLVDDEDDIREVAQMSLEVTAGWNIEGANCGTAGIEKAKELKPDAILLDVMMPDMDGYTVCQRLKENADTQNIPVIFLTAKSESEDMIKGFQCGGVDYITKPFQTPELLARVRTHTELKRNRDLILEYTLDLKERTIELERLNDEKNQFLL